MDLTKSFNFAITRQYIIFLHQKIIFTHIFKSGCESIRFLSLYENKQASLNDIDKWDWNMWCRSNDHIESHDLFESHRNINEYEWISIVRNPIIRVVSLYINLLIKNRTHSLLMKDILLCYNRNVDDGITFEEFVEYIIKKDRNTHNNHLRHQVDFIHKDKNKIKQTKIFKLENINEINNYIKSKNFRLNYLPKVGSNISPNIEVNRKDFEKECKTININKYIGNKSYKDLKLYIEQNKIPIYKNFLNKSTIQKLYNYYKDDFDYLNYDLSSFSSS
jgi:hypothetical protein